MAKTDLWMVLHHHRHGVDSAVVRCQSKPTEDEVVKACELEFEPGRDDEYIDIMPVDDIPTIDRSNTK